jgi:Sodium/hydrogen exchanger family/Hexameric tyrosine-coordinated heme protein (HTHP)
LTLIPGGSLITATAEEGRALALAIARHTIHNLQPELDILVGGRPSWGARLTLLAAFVGFVVVVALLILSAERSRRISTTLLELQDTIRIRGAVALLMVFAALAAAFGLEGILGAFLAGAALKLLDRDQAMSHTRGSTPSCRPSGSARSCRSSSSPRVSRSTSAASSAAP